MEPTNATKGDPIQATQRKYQVVVCASKNLGIAKDMVLPWKLPQDEEFYEKISSTTSDPTKKNACIMGRKTWDCLSEPFPNRLNVILTRSGGFNIKTDENVIICGSMKSALELLASCPYSRSIEKVFLIGGGEILIEYLNSPQCEAIHLTELEVDIECDTFIPPVDLSVFQRWYSSFPVVENNIRYSFVTYVRVGKSVGNFHASNGSEAVDCNAGVDKFEVDDFSFLPNMIIERHEEYMYLNLVNDIIKNGRQKNGMTGTGTLSKFGCQMRFNLRKYFPLLTTKRMFWCGIVKELLCFISGSSNAKVSQENGVNSSDGNASRELLNSVGLGNREEADLGPINGFQWRHFGTEGKGVDQLLDVINRIKNNPYDPQIILSSWNPSEEALPSRHMFAQFYVDNGELSCQMHQPSADMGLGVPFDVAAYSLLTCMIAHVCDLTPGDFIHILGDAHVRSSHVKALEEQIQRQPRPFPILKINGMRKDIGSFVASDFKLVDYHPHQKIEMKMAI